MSFFNLRTVPRLEIRFYVYTPDFAVICKIGEIIVSKILFARTGDNLLSIFVCFIRLKRAWRAFSFNLSSAIETLPVEEINVPR